MPFSIYLIKHPFVDSIQERNIAHKVDGRSQISHSSTFTMILNHSFMFAPCPMLRVVLGCLGRGCSIYAARDRLRPTL